MSASSKKMLRKEQAAAKMTEKQLAEQKEAKKLKLYTTAFVAVIAIVLVIAISVGITQTIANSGIREKNTVALTVGNHEVSNAELGYYYIDSINNFNSQYGSYAALFGLDTTKPLNEQFTSEGSTETWADYFINSAKDSILSVYALNDAAAAAGHTLTEEEQGIIDSNIATLEMYGMMYGHASGEEYLKAMYGRGATMETYRKYMEMSALADSYYVAYGQALTYEDADLRAFEEGKYNQFSSYNYSYYFLSASKFEETKAAEEAANSLLGAESVEAFNEAIAALPVNAETSDTATVCDIYPYSAISENVREWVTADERTEGDMTVIANTATSTDAEGNETTTTTGYYVVRFQSRDDNNFALKDVRHILAKFEGGTTDSATGTTTYSDEEKAAAKARAEELLATWESGDKTEESFAALANEKSDDGDGTTGGLYEDIYPGEMVTNFNDWCFDANRTVGETGIVETQFGYHVMYFVGDSDITYRDYQIKSELQSTEMNDWYLGLREATTIVEGNTNYVKKDIVLSQG